MTEELKPSDLCIEDVRFVLKMDGPYSSVFRTQDDQEGYSYGYKAVMFEFYWNSLAFLVSNGSFLFNLIYFILSMQGLIQSPVFYSTHLLDVINRFSQLQTVIRSVTMNLD